MRRVNSSHASLVISIAALFVALGGTAWAVTQISTSQIENSAVTTSKLHKHAVTNSKLANHSVGNAKLRNNSVSSSNLQTNSVSNSNLQDNSVSTSKLQNAAVTASQVAPNTFLPINGTAANSTELGGLPAADYLGGSGGLNSRRLVVPSGQTGQQLFPIGFGSFSASCTSNDPTVTWTAGVANAEYYVETFGFPTGDTQTTLNGIPVGGSNTQPATPALTPFAAWYSIGETLSTGFNNVATVFISGRFESGTGCVFVGQSLSTGS
ncbi:MAG TPA: hypothetical protein VG410_00115 [Solirubrobacteraceae bacterium]|jgi:hypothetical protein|nr:hypothetical protein [Solirubrobacteraceae bacterium]